MRYNSKIATFGPPSESCRDFFFGEAYYNIIEDTKSIRNSLCLIRIFERMQSTIVRIAFKFVCKNQ